MVNKNSPKLAFFASVVWVTPSLMPTAMATQNRRHTWVVQLVESAGWPLPRLYHGWPPRTMAESLGFMMTLLFLFFVSQLIF